MRVINVNCQNDKQNFKGIWKNPSPTGLKYFNSLKNLIPSSDVFKTSSGEHLFIWDGFNLPLENALKKLKENNKNLSQDKLAKLIKQAESIHAEITKPCYTILKQILKAIDKSNVPFETKTAYKQAQIDNLAQNALPIPDKCIPLAFRD